jgi:sec-independent protein translocase protein TatA
MNIFGIGLPEMAVIAAIGLLVFGPKRLPELGKTLGRTLRGFQAASQDFEKEFRSAMAPLDGAEPAALQPTADQDPAAAQAEIAPAQAPAPASAEADASSAA